MSAHLIGASGSSFAKNFAFISAILWPVDRNGPWNWDRKKAVEIVEFRACGRSIGWLQNLCSRAMLRSMDIQSLLHLIALTSFSAFAASLIPILRKILSAWGSQGSRAQLSIEFEDSIISFRNLNAEQAQEIIERLKKENEGRKPKSARRRSR